MDDFAEIRRLHRDKLSIRAIAAQLGVGRGTVRKALAHSEPVPYTLAKPRPAPTFGPFRSAVDEILAQDQAAPIKQRHEPPARSSGGSWPSTSTPAATTRSGAT